MEPTDLIRTVLGRWRLIVAAALAAGVVGAAVFSSAGAPPARPHQAIATVALTPAGRASGITLAPLVVLTTEGPVRERAASTLGELPNDALARRVQVRADEEAGVVTIAARSTDAPTAEATAAAFARALIDEVADRAGSQHAADVDDAAQRLESLEAEVERLDRQIAATDDETERDLLRAQRDALVRRASFAYETYQDLASGGHGQRLELLRVSEAQPDGSSILAPQGLAARVLLAVLFGAVLGILGALLVERFDARLRSRSQAEHAFGLPVLAEVSGRRKRLDIVRSPGSADAAGYRLVREAFAPPRNGEAPGDPSSNGHTNNGTANGKATANANGHARRAVLVTSAMHDARTAEVAANLAAAYGETGRTTVVISADLRKPRLHSLLDAPAEPGLLQVIGGDESATALHATSVPGVVAVPSGGTAPNPAGLLSTEAARAALRSLGETADTTIVASAGLLDGSDPAPLLPHVDGVVIVARQGKTTVAAARRTGELLRRAQVPIAGVLMIDGRGR